MKTPQEFYDEGLHDTRLLTDERWIKAAKAYGQYMYEEGAPQMLRDIRDYERESLNLIGTDEREDAEFLKIFNNKS